MADPATVEASASGAETAPADDPAAAVAGTTSSDPSPHDRDGESDRELRDAARLVLAGQDAHLSAGEVDLASVIELATAIRSGRAVDPSRAEAGMWEWRAAAVAAVVSGALTRGQTGRLMAEPSKHVAHWTRLHLEGMALVEPGEQEWRSGR